MKTICVKINIDNTEEGDYSDYITLGKIYQVSTNIYALYYQIIDDKGNKNSIPKELLTPIQDWRDIQLNKLGV